ncbi:MAG: radical SAM family heme chaperone HemW [Bacteroidales bacterium]
MSGIYIHIPFCKRRCHYCDFYSSTNESVKQTYTEAICHEMNLRKSDLYHTPQTIYFGGGTPSQLNSDEVRAIFRELNSNFDLSHCEEITFEMNPDDINGEYLSLLKEVGVNRISMGIQSFNDDLLKRINRRHDAQQAIDAVHLAQSMGFDNISIDLMYGLPGQDMDDWNRSLDIALSLNVKHISSYHLTYEEGTVLYKLLKEGKIHETQEELSLLFFQTLIDRLTEAGYEQYEISNFAKEDAYSRHNSSYWREIPYLGLGASAHSYDLSVRSWNPSSMKLYMQDILADKVATENEILNLQDKYNDYVITTLRTKWGADTQIIIQIFGEKLASHFNREAEKFIRKGLLKYGQGLGKCENEDKNFITLSREGIFVSDAIFEDLMYLD